MKMRPISMAFVAFGMTCAAVADATICAELGPPATLAMRRIQEHPDVRVFCGACGDTTTTAIRVVSVRLVPGAEDQLDLTDASRKTRRLPIRSLYVRRDPKRPIYSSVANYCVDKVVEPDIIGPSGPFPPLDAQAVAKVLANVNLKACASVGAEQVETRVLFSPVGDVVYAIALPPYANSDTGRCVAAQLRPIRITPFSGVARAVVQTLSVPAK
jgi:hypothetical protein